MSHPYDTIILPIERVLQSRAWSCGPAALKIILKTLGRDAAETDVIRLADAAPGPGTKTEAMSRVLAGFRVRHRVFSHATPQLVEKKISRLELCLVLYEAWNEGGRDASASDTGHYSVIFGFDKTHFYLADPFKRSTARHREPAARSSADISSKYQSHRAWGFRKMRKDLFDKRWRAKFPDGTIVKRWLIAVPLKTNRSR